MNKTETKVVYDIIRVVESNIISAENAIENNEMNLLEIHLKTSITMIEGLKEMLRDNLETKKKDKKVKKNLAS